jgi:predicted nucleotidyltransferase
MMPDRDENIKKLIKESVREIDSSAITILYGSRARKNARPDSDWDILILVKKPSVSSKDEQNFRHHLYDVELETGQAISTFVYSWNEWNSKLSATPLYHNIQREGIVL